MPESHGKPIPEALLPFSAFWSRQYAAGGAPPTWVIAQRLAAPLAWAAFRMRLTPSQVTLTGLLFSICGATAYALAPTGWAGAGLTFGLLALGYLFDCADGQVARATQRTSEHGAWLDVFCDYITLSALPAAMLWHHIAEGRTQWQLLLLVAASFVLVAGRSGNLFTATQFRRANKARFSPKGGLNLVRHVAVYLTDTLFFSFLACLLRDHILAVCALIFAVGTAGAAHSIYVAGQRFSRTS